MLAPALGLAALFVATDVRVTTALREVDALRVDAILVGQDENISLLVGGEGEPDERNVELWIEASR